MAGPASRAPISLGLLALPPVHGWPLSLLDLAPSPSHTYTIVGSSSPLAAYPSCPCDLCTREAGSRLMAGVYWADGAFITYCIKRSKPLLHHQMTWALFGKTRQVDLNGLVYNTLTRRQAVEEASRLTQGQQACPSVRPRRTPGRRVIVLHGEKMAMPDVPRAE